MTQAKEVRLNGVRQIIAFNWPKFVGAAVLVVVVAVVILTTTFPAFVDVLLTFSIVVTLWFSLLSLLASWWIYDRSDLYEWDWLVGSLDKPDSWLNIHTGFDETSQAWRSDFRSQGAIVDLFDPPRVGERSIERARARVAPDPASVAAKPSHLPFEDQSFDLVLVVFAAHEIASAEDRDSLFKEAERILRPHGRLLLVEHMRDFWNFAVFGPGFLHFYPRSLWRRHIQRAGLVIEKELTKTRFVRAFQAIKVDQRRLSK